MRVSSVLASGVASGLASGLAAVLALAVCPLVADAHIHLTSPLARTDSLTLDQKDQHCGVAGQTRNPARVTTFRPGETITVTWMETINHPGWFRIAFQPNGDVFGIPPATAGSCGVACPAGVANCNFPTQPQEGADGANGSIVLKDRIADGMLSTQITLPNMECDNCTLQFIQVMTDKCPYTIDAASDDIYFNCADIKLSNAAPMVDAGPTAGPDADTGGGGGGGGGPSDTTGGCAVGGLGGNGLALGLGLLGLVTLRRRRR